MNPQDAPWEVNWGWGLPLIVFTVVVHVCGMGLITERANRLPGGGTTGWRPMLKFLVRLAIAALLATALHAFEAATWAATYMHIGALSGGRAAMLYSLGAMTSYGHVGLFLPPEWQLLGALEALNGMMLFGLTTAFLFAIIQRIWPFGGHHGGPPG